MSNSTGPKMCQLDGVAATMKGYITKHKFHEYSICFVHFLKTQGLLNQNHLLIIDSHKSHVYNVAFFEEMLENNIHVLAIQPHTSHICSVQKELAKVVARL